VIQRFRDWTWEGVDCDSYKDEPGTWMTVARQNLSERCEGAFEVRYFEVAPGGYTSFERHEHEHCVIVLRGSGRVRLDNEWHSLEPHDVVRVVGGTPHQFQNPHGEPFGILCVVDKERDRPVLLDSEGAPRTSEQ
jgi:quercetin dioxygenase-like cupin family protein